MSKFIEPLILYAVLFFRFSAGSALAEEAVAFSAYTELARIALYNIPSLAMIWYLLLKAKTLKEWGLGIPCRRDFVPAALALPALVLIGFTIVFISRRFDQGISGPRFLPPQSSLSWIILVFSCFSTAYLEESYFRFYLLSKRKDLGFGPHRAVLFSVLLFSFCHFYEGPWGFLNAALSGLALAFIFYRYHSLHGIAFAHAVYNILVYVLNSE